LGVGVLVFVALGVDDGVGVFVGLAVGVEVGVGVFVGLTVPVCVGVAVGVCVEVAVSGGADVGVGVGESTSVGDGVGEGQVVRRRATARTNSSIVTRWSEFESIAMQVPSNLASRAILTGDARITVAISSTRFLRTERNSSK
jgi:hypothetical protein